MSETTEIYAFYDSPTDGLMCVGHDSSRILEQVEMKLWESDLCGALENALQNMDRDARVKVATIEYDEEEVTNINWE